MAEIEFTKLSSKGQIVIPRNIRNNLNLDVGIPLAIVEQDGIILIKKMKIPQIYLGKKDKMDLDIDKIKQKIVKILKKNNISKAGIFGSYARGDQKEDSDIDILIEFKGSLLDLVGLEMELKKVLNKKVDLLTYNGINPFLKEKILNEVISIL